MIVRMWEARARAGRLTELIEWASGYAVPNVEHHPSHARSELFSSADDRVVWISWWRSAPVPLPRPPGELVARAPHAWDFTPVDR